MLSKCELSSSFLSLLLQQRECGGSEGSRCGEGACSLHMAQQPSHAICPRTFAHSSLRAVASGMSLILF